jgi:uncharacterized protein
VRATPEIQGQTHKIWQSPPRPAPPGSYHGRMQWPQVGLDVPTGWRPSAFTQFVIKVHSRCNLACDYCYVYAAGDGSWRDQPQVMGAAVFARTCATIAEHARRHEVPAVSLVLHGGEPLLAGGPALDRFATLAEEIIGPVARVGLQMQTNGTLLTPEIVALCVRHGIRVAVSLDGGPVANERHRVRHDGGSSLSAVRSGLALLRRQPDVYAGLLCTVDTANDPIETYEALLEHAPPAVDFLLPHANWSRPPARPRSYGRWLISIFDRWFAAPVRQTRVRLFDDIMTLVLGGRVASEAVGLAPVRLAVVETDGTLEQVDALKTAFPGATRLTPTRSRPAGHRDGGWEAALTDPGIVARQIGSAALSAQCLACPVRAVCGGGHYAHRYHPESGFRTASVYCPDLFELINHITTAVRQGPSRRGWTN